ncbi:hypothetical protein THAOC_36567 [Thalassiosira oceanica]|uniref:Leucine-rich repeat domain-containing protein n=1 Tax=Thalassiosira oceanica TaxID=159749 RepID=K0R7Y2_THAOC|nr:hypothetical protein THAOC_36567 [Thalassiosira oceanica]|eukprot:EJK44861.1 hypothetical protein THAOC_36567 [Thalassiosira oceanica]
MEPAINWLNRIQGFHLYEGGEVNVELRFNPTHVHMSPLVREINAFSGCEKLAELQFKEGLEVIGNGAFYDCWALQKVTVPSTVTALGLSAFYGCSNLVEVRLNKGLQIIGECSFRHCRALRSVVMPSTIKELGKMAFIGCSNLAEVHLNEGLQILGAGAFADCTALRSVAIPSTVTELGDGAFGGCRSLIEVQLREGLQIIGKQAFANCLAIQSVTIPSTVTKFGTLAFHHCSNLSEVILLGGERLIDQAFLARGVFREEQGILNQGTLDEILLSFRDCPLTTVKLSISWAVSERMSRLLPEFEVKDDLETARSLYQVLQWIAFNELKESSILIELAIWKSRIDWETVELRPDCRVPIPDTVKSLIMEYCGFVGFLEPAFEGA